MGYRVEYETVPKVRRMEQKRSGTAALTAMFFVVFLLVTSLLWPEGREVLREIFLPGDPAVTVAALETLADELQTGAQLGDALENFCQSIAREAEIDPG